MKNEKTYELALAALFSAVTLLMAFTPFGYIPLVVINATIIHIPVILGALFLGPRKGAFLGFTFGLTSFINNTFKAATASAFVFSPVLAYQIAGVPGIFKSLAICFVPRILVGVFPYFVCRFVRGLFRRGNVGLSLACAGFAGAFTNTVLVMGGIFLFYRDAYAQAVGVAGDAVLSVILGVVAINGVAEAVVAAVIVAGVGAVLARVKPIYGKQAVAAGRGGQR